MFAPIWSPPIPSSIAGYPPIHIESLQQLLRQFMIESPRGKFAARHFGQMSEATPRLSNLIKTPFQILCFILSSRV